MPTGTPTPNNIRVELIKRVEQGENKKKVAQDMGLQYSTVWGLTRHVESARQIYPTEIKKKFQERTENGEIPAVVSRELGFNPRITYNWNKTKNEYLNLPEEIKQKILNQSENGLSSTQIAKSLLISVRNVTAILRESRGELPSNRRFTNELKHQAVQMIESGGTYASVAKALGAGVDVSIKRWHMDAIKAGIAKPYSGAKTSRLFDKKFLWVTKQYPHLDDWRESMAEWMKGEINAIARKTSALAAFLRYLHDQKQTTTRAGFLRRGLQMQDFFKTGCIQSVNGISLNNYIHDFLDWVLLHHFSDDSDGMPMVSPAFGNPVPFLSTRGMPTNTSSVREVLPYGFICQFRELLAAGPNFRDWTLAQSLMGGISLDGSNLSKAWFEVTENKIDRNDPDCVWRIRKLSEGSPVLEMWSPVRWVMLLIKMQMTARTGQVRMADSGESDTWRYINGQFCLNTSSLAQQNHGKLWQQGLFRRVVNLQGADACILYFNSNKTADIGKNGQEKGQECAWPHLLETSENPYYWLEKLRNWQEKYNPINGRMSWAKLPIKRGLSAKSEIQNAGYPDTCFLFRTPENSGEEHLPISNNAVDSAWQSLMEAFEIDLANKNITHADGSPILLIDRTSKSKRTKYPLHGNRVSLITAFIVDGGVDPVLMMKIVGHCRLMMTLYYTKPNFIHVQDALVGAAERLDSKKDESIIHWLVNANEADMLKRVTFNAVKWQTVVEVNPSLRNPLGWYLMHDGVCLAGGNTGVSDDVMVPGCHNGGALIKEGNGGRYGPVQGGILNCSLCRWKAAEKRHGPALIATLNNQLYHLRLKQEEAIKHSTMVNNLKKQKAKHEASGTPFGEMKEFKTAERLYEITIERLATLGMSIGGTHKMIQRVKALPEEAGNGLILASAGDLMTMNAVLEDIDSELLQLSGICGDVEIYPDLNPGTAVYRRSQILDAALQNHSLQPTFAIMNEVDQLIYGNALMRNLALQADPQNPILGLRKVVSILDHGKSLENILGIKLFRELAIAQDQDGQAPPFSLKIEKNNGKNRRTS